MTAAAEPVPQAAAKEDTLFGHPKGLYWLFFTEAAERFNFYGMRALLVLYLINYLQFRPGDASSVYKWYTSLVYMTPLIGGFLADRVLGLKRSIVIGGSVMAAGEFMLTLEARWALYLGLGLLILGNGFFKPNISTLVGKMYKPGDARRDGAFSIFYMGINLGAGVAPFVCGSLRQKLGFHYGFAAAGVVMVLGVIIFLLGNRRVLSDVAKAGNTAEPVGKKENAAPIEEEAEAQPGAEGFAGVLNGLMPFILLGLAVVVPALYVFNAAMGHEKWLNVIMPTAFALVGGAMARVLRSIKGAARDRTTVIFLLFVFAVLFWMAFEQAGNALNVWAEFNTRRYDLGPLGATTAEWYQSVNSVFIIALAPVFAMVWTWFENRGKGIPTPVKVLMTMVFTIGCFLTMVGSAAAEKSTVTHVKVAAIPPEVKLVPADKATTEGMGGELYALEVPSEDADAPAIKVHAGRMLYDKSKGELVVQGTLPPFAVMDALRPTVDPAYLASVGRLEKAVKYAEAGSPKTVLFGPVAAGYALPKLVNAEHHEIVKSATPVKLKVTPKTDTEPEKLEKAEEGAEGLELTFTGDLNPLAKSMLIGAGATPEWRQAVDAAAEQADAARVSGWWLILQYFFATLAELCISPVGLSLVTKLAPVRFAALFMGVWFLTNSVALYVGGALGELWGSVSPLYYFFLFVVTSAIGAVALIPLISPMRKLMHGIR